MNKTKAGILADQAIVSGSTLLTQLMIAGSLGLHAYGVFSSLILVQLFLLSLQQAGITSFYQVTYTGLDDSGKNRYTSGMWTIELIFLAAITALAILVYPFVHRMLGWTDALAILLNILLYLLQDFFRRLLLTRNDIIWVLVIDLLNNVLQVAGLAAMIWLRASSLSMVLWVCGLSFVPAVLIAVLRARLTFRADAIRSVYERHRREGSWMLSSAILQWFAGNFFVIAAGWWLGAASLGILRLGQYVFGLLNVLLQAVESYLLPQAGARSVNPQHTLQYLKSAQLKMLLGIGSLLAVIALAARPVLHFWPQANPSELLTVVYGMSILYLFIIAGYPVRIALRTLQLSHVFFKGYVLNALFGFTTAWLFIHHWQLKGVLAGLLLSQLLLLCYWISVLQRKYNVLWK